jgi:hypothetical protein
MDNSIVPAHLAVKAMRDNGYKNAAYALAELIDNSIQHGASKVELLCCEVEVPVQVRTVTRVNEIAVLDNGSGMTPSVLRMALQFGNGTHLEADAQKGIGKFGMGLPSSSISQAKKVEVWTWQNGVQNAVYTYLDIEKIMAREMRDVPEPIKAEVPKKWLKVGKCFSESGTLVLWSNIDRCVWKTATAIIENSEFLIGRMYRKYIDNGSVEIKMAAFKENNPDVFTKIYHALPNDPMYLMDNTSCPEPFDSTPMFDKWGDDKYEVTYIIDYYGVTSDVVIRFSLAKQSARESSNAGNRAHGKHAARNIGVSVVRAGRELDLDQAWVIQYDPRERWWGVEVEFQPVLDEVFGVTNNKQFANHFSEIGKIDVDDLLKDGKSLIQLRQELIEEGDIKAFLLEVSQKISSQIKVMRSVLKAQKQNDERDEKRRYDNNVDSPEKIATNATKDRFEHGFVGTSDKQESYSEDENKELVKSTLESEGITNAGELAEWLFTNNIKYSFVDADLESTAFFSVKSRGGKILISLNTSHPAYHKLVEVLEESTQDAPTLELQRRLRNASEGLKLLLMAWARYEDEQPDGLIKSKVQESRQDWGRIARQFLQVD